MANSEIDSQIESLQETSIFEKEIDILEKRGAKLSGGIQIKIERWHSVSVGKQMSDKRLTDSQKMSYLYFSVKEPKRNELC